MKHKHSGEWKLSIKDKQFDIRVVTYFSSYVDLLFAAAKVKAAFKGLDIDYKYIP